MPIVDITEIDELLGPDRTVAGIDLGTKTIGLAVSDLGLSFATPRAMIKRVKFTQDALALKLALDEARCGALVLGLPLNMDGTQGPRAQATRAFARNWSSLDDRPLAFWDERLSTVAAERVLIAADISRAKRATRIDSAAAAFILQGALDRLAALRAAHRAE